MTEPAATSEGTAGEGTASGAEGSGVGYVSGGGEIQRSAPEHRSEPVAAEPAGEPAAENAAPGPSILRDGRDINSLHENAVTLGEEAVRAVDTLREVTGEMKDGLNPWDDELSLIERLESKLISNTVSKHAEAKRQAADIAIARAFEEGGHDAAFAKANEVLPPSLVRRREMQHSDENVMQHLGRDQKSFEEFQANERYAVSHDPDMVKLLETVGQSRLETGERAALALHTRVTMAHRGEVLRGIDKFPELGDAIIEGGVFLDRQIETLQNDPAWLQPGFEGDEIREKLTLLGNIKEGALNPMARPPTAAERQTIVEEREKATGILEAMRKTPGDPTWAAYNNPNHEMHQDARAFVEELNKVASQALPEEPTMRGLWEPQL